jgi:AI-2E family transporter
MSGLSDCPTVSRTWDTRMRQGVRGRKSAVNIHPLVVVVAIIGGSLIMGLWGMVFAIPTVVVVKTAVETLFKELKDYRII